MGIMGITVFMGIMHMVCGVVCEYGVSWWGGMGIMMITLVLSSCLWFDVVIYVCVGCKGGMEAGGLWGLL